MLAEKLLGVLVTRQATRTFTEVLRTPSQQMMFLLLLVAWSH
jgi:hypothetical protein